MTKKQRERQDMISENTMNDFSPYQYMEPFTLVS